MNQVNGGVGVDVVIGLIGVDGVVKVVGVADPCRNNGKVGKFLHY